METLLFLELWTLVKDNVCYEGKNDVYGAFTFQRDGIVSAIKLQHISGLITCNKDNPNFGSGIWTCNHDNTKLSTVITDINKTVIFPPNVTMAETVQKVIFGDKDAYRMTPTELYFTKPTLHVSAGDSLQIWNTNDYGDTHDADNAGRHCVKVYAKFK